MDVLKKKFTKLCDCLPQDCMKTIDGIKELNLVSHDAVQHLRNINDRATINGWIMSVLIAYIKTDVDVLTFCDRMEQLVDNTTSKSFIDTLKRGKDMYILNCRSFCSDFMNLSNTFILYLL